MVLMSMPSCRKEAHRRQQQQRALDRKRMETTQLRSYVHLFNTAAAVLVGDWY